MWWKCPNYIFSIDYEDSAALSAPATAPKQPIVNTHAGSKAVNSTSTSSSKSSSNNKKEESSKKSDEEKRRHIKSIIDKIPTEKNALFNYPLDKGEIDSAIEKKIRPWINKKIIEYIGEPEPTLVDFICSKVLAGSTPQGILDDVQMVKKQYFPNIFIKRKKSFYIKFFFPDRYWMRKLRYLW